MSLIEQAAKRLEELRRAGAETTGVAAPAARQAIEPWSAPSACRRRKPQCADSPRAQAVRACGDPHARSGRLPSADRRAAVDRRIASSGGSTSIWNASRRGDLSRPTLPSRKSPTNSGSSSGRSSATRAASPAATIRNGNLIMVTSALPREGKTFTAVNLALSVAMEVDTTVLLVDGDVAHPELPKILGTPGSPGLARTSDAR